MSNHIVKEFTVTARSGTAITLTPLESSTGAGVDHGSVTITGASLTCCDRETLMRVGKGVRVRLELHD
jgi:hypothetical protein